METDMADDDDEEELDEQVPNSNTDVDTAYGFETYDDETNTPALNIGDIVELDPNEAVQDDDDDSDAEDDVIKPTDNLILVGRMAEDAANMEIFIYNGEEGSLYVHRDFNLLSTPLCMAWFDHDPEVESSRGNLLAIGSMDPIITIWDLDMHDCLEPIYKLGSKGSARKNTSKFGHQDAVLALSWNKYYSHILASASVDKSVILWDLDDHKPKQTIRFDGKVQTIDFHPGDGNSLLAGACDGTVRLFDCRTVSENGEENYLEWKLSGEVESATWNPLDPQYFMSATNDGQIHYIDIRSKGKILWSKKAHEKEVSGVAISPYVQGMLTTVSSDGFLKVWDYDKKDAKTVHTEAMKIGSILCLDSCPENPFVVAIGGTLKSRNLRVVDLLEYDDGESLQ